MKFPERAFFLPVLSSKRPHRDASDRRYECPVPPPLQATGDVWTGFAAAVRPTLSVADEVLGSEKAGLKTPRALDLGQLGEKGREVLSLCSGHTADGIPESLHHGGGLSLFTQRAGLWTYAVSPMAGVQRWATRRQTPREAPNRWASGGSMLRKHGRRQRGSAEITSLTPKGPALKGSP